MVKRKSVFTAAQRKTKLLQAKIPLELYQRTDTINEQLQKIKPELKFDRTQIIINALEEAANLAETELTQLQNKGNSSETQTYESKNITQSG